MNVLFLLLSSSDKLTEKRNVKQLSGDTLFIVVTIQKLTGGFGKPRFEQIFAACRNLWEPFQLLLLLQLLTFSGQRIDGLENCEVVLDHQ